MAEEGLEGESDFSDDQGPGTRSRCLREGFCRQLHADGAWPRRIAVRSWFTALHLGWSDTQWAALRKGELLPEKFVLAFVRMLLEARPGDAEFAATRECLIRFLASVGVVDVSLLDDAGVIAIVAHPPTYVPRASSKRGRIVDYLKGGFVNFAVFCAERPVRHFVRGCADAAAVREVARWMYVRFGQMQGPRGPNADDAEAIDVAQSVVGLPMERYQENAVSWHAFSPWTVLRARQNGRDVGATIVLPLTPTAYGEIRSGRQASCDVMPHQLELPSCHLLLEGCAEVPDAHHRGGGTSKALLACLVMQHAVMIRAQRLPPTAVVRILSFAGTEQNKARLLDSGFVPVGRSMHRTNKQLLERVVPLNDPEGGLGTIESGILMHGGRTWVGAPPA